MTNPKDLAFPHRTPVIASAENQPAYQIGEQIHFGLTKREYFAAMALNHEVQYVLEAVDSDLAKETFRTIAANCVRMADALIAELSNKEKS